MLTLAYSEFANPDVLKLCTAIIYLALLWYAIKRGKK